MSRRESSTKYSLRPRILMREHSTASETKSRLEYAIFAQVMYYSGKKNWLKDHVWLANWLAVVAAVGNPGSQRRGRRATSKPGAGPPWLFLWQDASFGGRLTVGMWSHRGVYLLFSIRRSINTPAE